MPSLESTGREINYQERTKEMERALAFAGEEGKNDKFHRDYRKNTPTLTRAW